MISPQRKRILILLYNKVMPLSSAEIEKRAKRSGYSEALLIVGVLGEKFEFDSVVTNIGSLGRYQVVDGGLKCKLRAYPNRPVAR